MKTTTNSKATETNTSRGLLAYHGAFAAFAHTETLAPCARDEGAAWLAARGLDLDGEPLDAE